MDECSLFILHQADCLEMGTKAKRPMITEAVFSSKLNVLEPDWNVQPNICFYFYYRGITIFYR